MNASAHAHRRRPRKLNANQIRYLSRTLHAKMTPEKAFRSLTARVDWLNGKIDKRIKLGEPFDLYVEERDAILWMMDEIARQARKILDLVVEVETNKSTLD